MRNYIFVSGEGYTYQPNSESPEPDIENCQVIGFVKGNNENEAFDNMVKENAHLLATNFNEIVCMELKNEKYIEQSKYFYLDSLKKESKEA